MKGKRTIIKITSHYNILIPSHSNQLEKRIFSSHGFLSFQEECANDPPLSMMNEIVRPLDGSFLLMVLIEQYNTVQSKSKTKNIKRTALANFLLLVWPRYVSARYFSVTPFDDCAIRAIDLATRIA